MIRVPLPRVGLMLDVVVVVVVAGGRGVAADFVPAAGFGLAATYIHIR